MKEKTNSQVYKTRDFYLSCILLASGKRLLHLERGLEKWAIFVFDCNPEEAKEIILKHWSGELLLPTRTVVEAIKQLKTMLYAEI